jgi:predicted permease
MAGARRGRSFRFPWRSSRQITADVDEELGFHLDMRVDELVRRGMSPEAARAAALREFGDLDDARRYIGAVDRDIEASQRRSELMRDFLQDAGYALRKLRSAPLFTLTVIVTLALGIGANTAIFSVVNGVILKPLPFPSQERLMRIRFDQGGGDASTPPDLTDFRARSKTFESFALYEGAIANLERPNADPIRIVGVRVSANWFSVLRVKPLYGRFFAQGEDVEGAPDVIVLSERIWRREFGADPSIVGKTLQINATPMTVVGIARADRQYPMTAEVWLPTRFDTRQLSDAGRGARWLSMLGRVKDGVPVDRAIGEVDRIERQMEQLFPEVFRNRRAIAVPLQQFIVGDVRKPLYVILAAVGLVLLVACANVANLMLVRATAREGEMAIRTALGAGRGRLTRQLITESVILSLTGAAAGVLLAKWGMSVLLSMAPDWLPRIATVRIDATTLAVTAAIALVIGVAFGILPAFQVGARDLTSALRAGGRGGLTQHSANRIKRVIVVAEVALAVTLLSGAGLLIRSFQRLVAVDPGFRPEGVLTMKLRLPARAYDDVSKLRQFESTLESRLRELPGVRTAAVSNYAPLDGSSFVLTYTIRGRAPVRPSDEPAANIRLITPDYFTVIGTPMVSGRHFSADDRAGAPQVIMVNRALAQKQFPNENPIGKYIEIGWTRDGVRQGGQIVGVVGDTRDDAMKDEASPTVYLPLAQVPVEGVTISVRSAASPTSLVPALRNVVREIDRTIPVFDVKTLEERVRGAVGPERFYATVLGIFAGVALVLAAIGLYGVIAYAVGQRTHELGVRVALGATSRRITGMVIREGLVITVIGAVLGITGAAAASRYLASLLYNVKPSDPMIFGTVTAALLVVSALASYLPARRAAKVDPLMAMRGD